jgi:hypothetical protein
VLMRLPWGGGGGVSGSCGMAGLLLHRGFVECVSEVYLLDFFESVSGFMQSSSYERALNIQEVSSRVKS